MHKPSLRVVGKQNIQPRLSSNPSTLAQQLVLGCWPRAWLGWWLGDHRALASPKLCFPPWEAAAAAENATCSYRVWNIHVPGQPVLAAGSWAHILLLPNDAPHPLPSTCCCCRAGCFPLFAFLCKGFQTQIFPFELPCLCFDTVWSSLVAGISVDA